jgi:hypothetical protein
MDGQITCTCEQTKPQADTRSLEQKSKAMWVAILCVFFWVLTQAADRSDHANRCDAGNSYSR